MPAFGISGERFMDHICLSPRLQMVADFVPPCACAADIGTDHGYLPIWLLQNGVIRSAIAADIHAGPLANARQSAADYDLEEHFRFVLADGLRFPDAQAADVVTIAGVGGETICAILAAAPWLRQGKQLVLQPQSKVPEEIRRQTRARAGMTHAKQIPATELAALDARLSQLQACLKEVQTWQS